MPLPSSYPWPGMCIRSMHTSGSLLLRASRWRGWEEPGAERRGAPHESPPESPPRPRLQRPRAGHSRLSKCLERVNVRCVGISSDCRNFGEDQTACRTRRPQGPEPLRDTRKYSPLAFCSLPELVGRSHTVLVVSTLERLQAREQGRGAHRCPPSGSHGPAFGRLCFISPSSFFCPCVPCGIVKPSPNVISP